MGYDVWYEEAELLIAPALSDAQASYLVQWLRCSHEDKSEEEIAHHLELESRGEAPGVSRAEVGLPVGEGGRYLLCGIGGWGTVPFILSRGSAGESVLTLDTDYTRLGPDDVVERLGWLLGLLSEWGCSVEATSFDWRGEEWGDLGRVYVKGTEAVAIAAEVEYPEPSGW